jgi:sodium/proline symporter
VVSAFFTLVFFLFYTTSGLVAGGKLFNGVFGFPYAWAVLAGVLTIVVYTFLGGFLAVCWTDVIQSLLMLFALLAVPWMALEAIDGWGEVSATMVQVNVALLDPWTDSDGAPLTVLALASLLAWGLGYFGQPHILARFMAIRAAQRVPWARRIATGWAALSMLGALAVGITAIGLFPDPLGDPEKVFIRAVELLFHPWFAGICLAAILAAIMSTADSQLLVAASALTEDLYKGLLRRAAGQGELVWVGRLTVLGFAVAASVLALDPESKVLDLVAYAWAGFGCAFGPAVVFSLFWRRMTGHGALAGIVTGALTVIVWKQLHGGLFDLYEMVPGFALATLAIAVVSLLGPQPARQTLETFDAVNRAPWRGRGRERGKWLGD